MTQSSPAAQAIRQAVDAVVDRSPVPPTTEEVAAAVLRAAAEEIVLPKYGFADWEMAHLIMQELQNVADELESTDA